MLSNDLITDEKDIEFAYLWANGIQNGCSDGARAYVNLYGLEKK